LGDCKRIAKENITYKSFPFTRISPAPILSSIKPPRPQKHRGGDKKNKNY